MEEYFEMKNSKTNLSLALDKINNHPDSPAPMSVLEWRRTVWFQVHSIHHHQNSPQNIEKIQFPFNKNNNFMLKHSSKGSDSGDESVHGRMISRPLRLQNWKQNNLPLIDLTQPTDSEGRPIQIKQEKPELKDKSIKADPNLEQRHRRAIRKLQAEATEQLFISNSLPFDHHPHSLNQTQTHTHVSSSKINPLHKISNLFKHSPFGQNHLKSSFNVIMNKFSFSHHLASDSADHPKYKKLFSLGSGSNISQKSLLSSDSF